jgi:hypothetical protein
MFLNYKMDDNLIHVNFQPDKINSKQLKIMVFVMNALEKGWKVKKDKEQYIFTKKHENKKEVFREEYLEQFLLSNFQIESLDSIK